MRAAGIRVFGVATGETFASWDSATSFWRDGEQEFSRSWPRSGASKSGRAVPLRDSGHRAVSSGAAISFPTPSAAESHSWRYIEVVDKDGNPPAHPNQRFYDKKTGRHVQKSLEQIATAWLPGRSWGTPRASNGMTSRLRDPAGIKAADGRLEDQVAIAEGRPGGWLNPEWVEWLMGFPAGWSLSEPPAAAAECVNPEAVPVATPRGHPDGHPRAGAEGRFRPARRRSPSSGKAEIPPSPRGPLMTRNRRGSDDPRALLGLLAVVAGFALLRLLDRLDPHRISNLLRGPAALPIALGATVIASALARQRHVATARTLAARLAVAIVPADEFDAAPELVGSFAAQLARSGRRIGGWWDRRASALRVRLTNDGEGRLVYLLEVPERDLPALRGALRSYPGVEIREAAEVLAERPAAADPAVVLRTELVLARPSVEPLARQPLDPDPLAPFAATLAGLRPDRGEGAEVCVDLLPVGGLRLARLRATMRRQARRGPDHAGEGLRAILGGGRPDRRDPAELAERRDLNRGLDVKLRGGAPLFEAQILLRATAPDRPGAESTMRGLLAAFGPFSDRNWLRASGIHLAGLAFLGADLPVRRRGFDRRLQSGLFRPARRSVVTTAEIAGLLKPPTVNCRVDNVLRSGTLLAPPPDLDEFKPGRRDLIPVGRVTGERGERIVGVRAEDTFFTYVAGRSRWGKTETAIAMFTHLVRSGHGGLFLDPHGDALDRIRPYLGEPGVAERVVEIDLGPGGGEDQPCWNLFELRGVDPEARVEAVVDAFATAMGWGERSTRAINLITQTASALAAISRELPPELAPTVFQIPTLLTDSTWRETVVPCLPESAQSFWRERFPRLSDEAVTPLTNLVDRMGASRRTAALLGASRSTFSLREAMDSSLIVLFCPGHGGTRERLIANLALFDNYYSARSRGEIAPGERSLFWPVLDEAQTYDSETLTALPEQGAKFGIRAIILNQNPERLRPATLDSLTTNRSHMIITALNARAASLVTKEWAGEPRPEAITRLPRYRFVAQVTHRGELSRPFALGGVRVEDALGAPPAGGLERLAAARGCSGRRRPTAEVLAELATLDGRIAEGLRARRRAAARRAGQGRRRGEDCGAREAARPRTSGFEVEVESS